MHINCNVIHNHEKLKENYNKGMWLCMHISDGILCNGWKKLTRSKCFNVNRSEKCIVELRSK